MRRLRIEHVTGYAYEGEVGASYNEARMLPSSTDAQSVLSAQLEIAPAASVYHYTDYFGSRVAAFDVLAPHETLSITARSLVEVTERHSTPPPIDWGSLAAMSARAVSIAEMTAPTARTRPHPEVAELAHGIARGNADPLAAARRIAEAVGEAVEYTPGITQVHSTAAEVWDARKGVCQDIVHITLGALREVGIPARYVSGYLHPKRDAEIGETVRGESHAWVEWFAGGWQGFDPTNGTEIGTSHVLVGRGRDYTDVPPLRGVYAGPFTGRLHVDVSVTREA